MIQKRTLQTPFQFIQKNQYVTALEHYKRIVSQNPLWVADALIPLYRLLQTRQEDWYLRLIIAEIYVSARYFSDALYELEDIYEENLILAKSCFYWAKYGLTNPMILGYYCCSDQPSTMISQLSDFRYPATGLYVTKQLGKQPLSFQD